MNPQALAQSAVLIGDVLERYFQVPVVLRADPVTHGVLPDGRTLMVDIWKGNNPRPKRFPYFSVHNPPLDDIIVKITEDGYVLGTMTREDFVKCAQPHGARWFAYAPHP